MVNYSLTLTEDQLKTYVTGLDSSIKLIAAQLSQGNSAVTLRNFLPSLINLNQELLNLDKIIDEQNKEAKDNSQTLAATVSVDVVKDPV